METMALPTHKFWYRSARLIITCFLLLAAFKPVNAAELQISSTFLELDSRLDDVIALSDDAFKPQSPVEINPYKRFAAAWLKITLPSERRAYRLTMPFSLSTQLDVYAFRTDGSVSAYKLGAYGSDTRHQGSALGHQIKLDPKFIDFAQPIYVKAKTSLFFNQLFDLLPEDEYQSLEAQLTVLHKITVGFCIIAIFAYTFLLFSRPSAIVGATLAFLIGLLFLILSTISINLITTINFQYPALQKVALFEVSLIFFLVAICLRRLGMLAFISPRIDKILYLTQSVSLLTTLSALSQSQDTADNLALISVLFNLTIISGCVVALIVWHFNYKTARTAVVTFGIPSLGGFLYIGPAYFDIMPATSGYLVLPITLIVMVVSLLLLVPHIASGRLHQEHKELMALIASKRPFMPLAMRYSIVVLSFGLMFILSATVIQSALQSRATETSYRQTASQYFESIKGDLRQLLVEPSSETSTIDKTIGAGTMVELQLSDTHRDGPILYQQGNVQSDFWHASYFDVQSHGRTAVAKITLDITQAFARETVEHRERLISNFILAGVVSIFCLVVFRILVTNHLESMADHLSKIELKKDSNTPLKLVRDNELHTDELDFLSSAVHKMEEDLHTSYQQLSRSKSALEHEVMQRTKAYSAVLEREHRKRHLVSMGLMVAAVAHELRNPLGTLANTVQLMHHKFGNDQPKLLKRMQRSIERCNNVIEELRSMDQQSSISLRATNMSQWLSSVLEEYQRLHHHKLIRHLGDNILSNIDQNKMEQVLYILLDNARQSIQGETTRWPEHGLIEVNLDTVENSRIKLQVIDNGRGIPPSIKDKLFEPLTTSKPSGFGMGLSIALDIIEQHEGELTLENTSYGACATIIFAADP